MNKFRRDLKNIKYLF